MSKSRNSVFLWIAILCVSICQAQPRADSLRNLIKTDKEDTTKVIHLALLAYELRSNEPAQCRKYASEALALAQKKQFVRGMGLANLAYGTASLYLGEFADALNKLNEAVRAFTAIGAQRDLARAHNNLGVVYWYQGNYPQALKTYFSVLKAMEDIADKQGMASAYNNIANVYYNQQNYPDAIKYHQASLKLKKETGDRDGEAWSYNNIGEAYRVTGNFTQAAENFQHAFDIFSEVQDKKGMSDAVTNLGILLKQNGQYEKALENFNRSLKWRQENGDQDGEVNSYINLGMLYGSLGKYSDTDSALSKGLRLAREIGNKDAVMDCYRELASLDSARHNYKASLAHYKKYISYRDSLVNEENTKKTVQAQMQYEFDKKESATRLDQEKKDAIATAETKKQRIILFAISGFGLLVLGFAIFAYRSFLQKKRANIEISNQKHLIEEKQKEILDSIYYARRIQSSLMPNEKYIARILDGLKK